MKGELLQELRRDKGLSQKQLGALLSVSPFTISSYECGHSDSDDEAKVKLAKIFDISPRLPAGAGAQAMLVPARRRLHIPAR